jgi:hypothetical protein
MEPVVKESLGRLPGQPEEFQLSYPTPTIDNSVAIPTISSHHSSKNTFIISRFLSGFGWRRFQIAREFNL